MCLSPMIPHVTHELWHQLGHETALIHERWWAPDPDALVQDTIEISVQVNGKMRARVSSPGRCDAGNRRAGRAGGRERAEVRRGQTDPQGDLRARQTGQHRRMKRAAAAVLVAALAFAGCGFHLQGRQPLPEAFANTYIDTKDEQTDFVQDLRKALIASGVEGDPLPRDLPAPRSACTRMSSPSGFSRCRRATSPPNTSSPIASSSR